MLSSFPSSRTAFLPNPLVNNVKPGNLFPPKKEVDNVAGILEKDRKSYKKIWKLNSDELRLGSSQAGQLSTLLVELLSAARLQLALAKTRDDFDTAKEIQQQMAHCEELFIHDSLSVQGTSDGTWRNDVSIYQVEEAVNRLRLFLDKLEETTFDGSKPISRLRASLKATQEKIHEVNLESKFYSQVAAKSLTNQMHCLATSLTLHLIHQSQNNADVEARSVPNAKLHNRSLYHYALFSDNIVAMAVVVNSTEQNLKQPWKHVFHIVTDQSTYPAVLAWFKLHPPKAMSLEVRCLEEFRWINSSNVPVVRQIETKSMRMFYFKTLTIKEGLGDDEDAASFKFRNPKYLSILNHLRFYLPQVFPSLDKILFLDDDVVVQKDLSLLWKVPMDGNVNLAVETCGLTFHRFWTYLNFSNPLLSAGGFDPQGCAWAFGMNLFDLQAWRQGDFTSKYHYWQRQNENRTLWKLGTLPAGLLTFYNATKALDRSWQVLGLGSLYNISLEAVEKAAVIHFNGHAKPWLDLAIARYQPYWRKYLNSSDEFLVACALTGV